MDWKDQLKAFAESNPDLPEGADPTPDPETAPQAETPQRLQFFLEKKGRKGKTATIITGFTCSDDELRATLKKLQAALGTGGSARGGEILLQGDWLERAREILQR